MSGQKQAGPIRATQGGGMNILTAWWFIPLLITIGTVSGTWLLTRGDSFIASVQFIILLPLSLIVSIVAWAVAGALK